MALRNTPQEFLEYNLLWQQDCGVRVVPLQKPTGGLWPAAVE